MPDTVRSRAELQALFADNILGDVSPQDLRDYLASVTLAAEEAAPFDPAAIASDLLPDADATRSLGSAALRWAEVRASQFLSLGLDVTVKLGAFELPRSTDGIWRAYYPTLAPGGWKVYANLSGDLSLPEWQTVGSAPVAQHGDDDPTTGGGVAHAEGDFYIQTSFDANYKALWLGGAGGDTDWADVTADAAQVVQTAVVTAPAGVTGEIVATGVGVYETGSQILDSYTGLLYRNVGTIDAPVWASPDEFKNADNILFSKIIRVNESIQIWFYSANGLKRAALDINGTSVLLDWHGDGDSAVASLTLNDDGLAITSGPTSLLFSPTGVLAQADFFKVFGLPAADPVEASQVWAKDGQLVLSGFVGGRVHSNVTQVGNVGADEDDLMSYELPVNTLNIDGRAVRITCWGSAANNVNDKTLRLYFGDGLILFGFPEVSVAGQWRMEAIIVRSGSDTQATSGQFHSFAESVPSFVSQIGNDISAQVDSAPIVIKLTGEGTATDDITQNGLIVEVL